MIRSIRMAALALAFFPLAANAAETHPSFFPPPVPTLSVTGEGSVARPPDQAKLVVQIVTDASDATSSSSKNNDLYNDFKSRLGALSRDGGVRLRDAGYNVQYIPYPPKGLPPEQRAPRYGYVNTRTVEATISPIDAVGRVIDAATAAGVTTVGNVVFGLKDPHAAYLDALGSAMRDAATQARALAAAGGFQVASIRTVSTASSPPLPFPPSGVVAMRAMAMAGTPTELTPASTIDVEAHVTVIYAIR